MTGTTTPRQRPVESDTDGHHMDHYADDLAAITRLLWTRRRSDQG